MPLKYATILYVTKDKAYLHSSLVLVLASAMYRHNFSRNCLRRGKKTIPNLHTGSPVNKQWSRFGNHVAYHVSVTSLIESCTIERPLQQFHF